MEFEKLLPDDINTDEKKLLKIFCNNNPFILTCLLNKDGGDIEKKIANFMSSYNYIKNKANKFYYKYAKDKINLFAGLINQFLDTDKQMTISDFKDNYFDIFDYKLFIKNKIDDNNFTIKGICPLVKQVYEQLLLRNNNYYDIIYNNYTDTNPTVRGVNYEKAFFEYLKSYLDKPFHVDTEELGTLNMVLYTWSLYCLSKDDKAANLNNLKQGESALIIPCFTSEKLVDCALLVKQKEYDWKLILFQVTINENHHIIGKSDLRSLGAIKNQFELVSIQPSSIKMYYVYSKIIILFYRNKRKSGNGN